MLKIMLIALWVLLWGVAGFFWGKAIGLSIIAKRRAKIQTVHAIQHQNPRLQLFMVPDRTFNKTDN